MTPAGVHACPQKKLFFSHSRSVSSFFWEEGRFKTLPHSGLDVRFQVCEAGGERWSEKVIVQGTEAISPETNDLSSTKERNFLLSSELPYIWYENRWVFYVSCDHPNAPKAGTVFVEMQDNEMS